ncbi:MAG: archaeosortase/exosortase family protein [Deltaproteobacteria bacterium]|nr:archaeosortase/exosortase family protein [Deltaproteobacteria bacterium]
MIQKKLSYHGFSRGQEVKKQADKKTMSAFTIKFLSAILFSIIPLSLFPEEWYTPLNRFTAFLSGEVISLFLPSSVVHGSLISVRGFRVNVISECSAIHLMALLASFIYAFPSVFWIKFYGIISGVLFLFSVNIIRIAMVTIIGMQMPGIFDIFHIYLGQMIMMIIMISFSLYWGLWVSGSSDMESPGYYILRFLVFSAIGLVIWLFLNRVCMTIIDYFVMWFFAIISYPVDIPRTHAYYYQTFSLISLTGLLLAFKKVKLSIRIRWTAYGAMLLFFFQIILRICNAWITAYGVEWMAGLSQVIYNLCVYAIPVIFTSRLFMKTRLARTKFAGT